MTDYRRLYIEGGTYFFTVITNERRPIFRKEENIDNLRAIFRTVMKKRPFKIEAIVILPDHIHCIWTLPKGDNDYSVRWKEIKYRFSLNYKGSFPTSESMKKKREKGLWQRRFWEHLIRNQEDLNRHIDYIHYNPVKHELTQKVIEWPYSSFRQYLEEGIYDRDWGEIPPSSIKTMELE